MKLASFHHAGRASYGAVVDNGIIDIGSRLGARAPTLRDAIAGDVLSEIAGIVAGAQPDVALSSVSLDLPIPNPSKVILIGRNYRGHVAEAAGKLPEKPSVFIRALDTFVPHGGKLVRPRISDNFDYEGELAFVIGRPARHVTQAAALSYIAGYTILNDGSIRDYQFTHSLTVGKNFFHSGSIGPWMVTSDEIPDPTQLMLHTRLNQQEVQHTKTDDLIFDIPFLMEYLSAFIPLVPGDIIATGTPEGVGFARKPPLWMKPGDTLEVEISGIGLLRNEVVAE